MTQAVTACPACGGAEMNLLLTCAYVCACYRAVQHLRMVGRGALFIPQLPEHFPELSSCVCKACRPQISQLVVVMLCQRFLGPTCTPRQSDL